MDVSTVKRSVWSKVGVATLGCALFAGAGSAAAATPPPNVEAPDDAAPPEAEPVLTGELWVGAFAGRTPEAETAAVAPRTRLGIRVRPEAELNLDIGMATLHQNRDGNITRHGKPSNLGFGFRFLREERDDRFRHAFVGFEFALPTAVIDETRNEVATIPDLHRPGEYAIAIEGGWSPWRWTPATLALVVPVGWRGEVLRRFELGFEGAVAGLFPAGLGTSDTTFAAQAAGQARYVLPWLGVGVRTQAVYNGRHEVDRTQLSVAPMLDTSLCRKSAGRRIQGVVAGQSAQCPVSLTARVHVNIERPYGFASADAMRVWGLQVGMGWAVF